MKAFAIALLLAPTALADDQTATTLVVTMTEATIELDVPASEILLSLPRGNLVTVDDERTGSRSHPRYFYFHDAARGVVVSGWIESAEDFGDPQKFWAAEMAAMKKSGQVPTEAPRPVSIGDWSGISYELQLPVPGVNTHIRAELIARNTWVDLHVSVTREAAIEEARAAARDFVQGIVIKEKVADPPAQQ